MSSSRLFLALIATALSGFAGARAQSLIVNDYTTTEIIAESDSFAPGQTLWFAIRQELRPGWHVFWTNPGDAGLPLKLDWSLPANYAAGPILHPVPDYIPVGPLASYAHEGAPVFLTSVTAPADARPGDLVSVTIDASWQACEDICVPEEGTFSFSMPVAAAASLNTAHTDLFSGARGALPEAYDGGGVFSASGGAYVLDIAAPADFSAQDAFFFTGPEGLVEASAKQKIAAADGRMRIELRPGWTETYDAPSLDGVLAYQSQNGARRGLAITADVLTPIIKPQAPPPSVIAAPAGLPLLLLFAFLGGAILNIMPCVFPIIFIKAASFMQSAREHPRIVRRDGLLFTAGVLATFLLMGGVLLALRAGGEQFGWGFHLQSPAVVALSAYVLLLVGLNLSGVFSVGHSLAGAGGELAAKPGGAGAFFTGALAVVVAAPCIGPLLSAPMGAALMLAPLTGMAIFAALGLGLATPYLLLSFAPGLGRMLPKPGPWMATFKQALAFPVFGAAAYFIWVLAQQANGAGLAAVLAGAVLIAFAAWLFEQSKGDGRRAFVLRLVSGLAAVAALAPLTRLEADSARAESGSYGALETVAYSDAALERYRVAGTPVFIDFTAAWCVTCQFNKLTIFSTPSVATAFSRSDTVFMVADWTVRDPEITAALERFGASGVPLYVYYSPAGEPSALSLPLTRKSLLAALSGAGR